MGLFDLFEAMQDATRQMIEEDEEEKRKKANEQYYAQLRVTGYWVCPRCGTTNKKYNDSNYDVYCNECHNRRPF